VEIQEREALRAKLGKSAHDREERMAKQRKICVHFAQGRCNKGANCTFLHEGPVQRKAKQQLCHFFLSGRCTQGDACAFSHVLSDFPCADYHTLSAAMNPDALPPASHRCPRPNCGYSHAPMTAVQRATAVRRMQLWAEERKLAQTDGQEARAAVAQRIRQQKALLEAAEAAAAPASVATAAAAASGMTDIFAADAGIDAGADTAAAAAAVGWGEAAPGADAAWAPAVDLDDSLFEDEAEDATAAPHDGTEQPLPSSTVVPTSEDASASASASPAPAADRQEEQGAGDGDDDEFMAALGDFDF
jgi:hypothetical protein